MLIANETAKVLQGPLLSAYCQTLSKTGKVSLNQCINSQWNNSDFLITDSYAIGVRIMTEISSSNLV